MAVHWSVSTRASQSNGAKSSIEPNDQLPYETACIITIVVHFWLIHGICMYVRTPGYHPSCIKLSITFRILTTFSTVMMLHKQTFDLLCCQSACPAQVLPFIVFVCAVRDVYRYCYFHYCLKCFAALLLSASFPLLFIVIAASVVVVTLELISR